MVTIGERVGTYRVVRAIGSGGMGMVFEAVHETIRSRAAIKILHAQFSENSDVRARFFNEALAVNLVQHPGIVSVFEHGQLDSGAAYIIMEYLQGESLRARIEATARARAGESAARFQAHAHGGNGHSISLARPLDRPTALRLLRQLASAMAAAHSRRIVHRDLKPENIMIVRDPFALGGERVKVLDFGIAKVLGPDGIRGHTGGLLGTPTYMAPEAWEGAGTVDEKVDVYALGMILFEVLTGQLPFEDVKSNVVKWQQLHASGRPLSLRAVDPSIPEPLDTLCGRMLSKRPQDRPEMSEVASELEQLVGLNLRFRAGGFVRDGEFYARRAADEALFYALLNGQNCHVLGPRQIGKTSLMHSVVHRLSNVRGPELERGILCAVLDLLSVESSGTSAELFYFELVRELFRGLGLPGIPTDFWAKNRERAPRPAERFALLLRELPEQLGQPAAIFVDHVEVLLRLPLAREEFFAALWSAQTHTADSKAREKGRGQLALCVLGTAIRQELMPDERHSPFTRSRPIPLGDFSSSEARAFLPGLHSLGAASDKALAAILGWTSGHPCLTQRLCEGLATRPLPDGSVQHLVDSVAAEVIATNRRREDPSFAFAEEGVRRAGALRPALLSLYHQVLENAVENSLAAPAAAVDRLEMLGLARREGTALRVRNRIFAEVFSLEWLRGEEAVRPLQSALDLWQANHRHVEYLLSGPLLSDALAWARGRQDLTADEQAFLNASVDSEQHTQRRRVALLLAAVMVLLASLVGTGLLWRNVRLAKQQVEAHQLRTEAALRDAERARKEAENAREKTLLALKAADTARRAAEEARIETEGALNEAEHQRGVALSAKQRAKLATERALLAAHEAQKASQNAQEASRRADVASQSVDRALSEKAQAIALLEGRLQQCDKERKASDTAAQRCQQGLEAREAETQSLRGNVGSLNSQIATLNTQLATVHAQLAGCRGNETARPAATSPPPAAAPEPSPPPAAAPPEAAPDRRDPAKTPP